MVAKARESGVSVGRQVKPIRPKPMGPISWDRRWGMVEVGMVKLVRGDGDGDVGVYEVTETGVWN